MFAQATKNVNGASDKPTPKPRPCDQLRIFPPWYDRLAGWLAWVINMSSREPWFSMPRVRTLLRWLSETILRKAPRFIWTVTGGKVSIDAYAVRQSECRSCDDRLHVLEEWKGRPAEDIYCSRCGCGIWVVRWPFSRRIIAGAPLAWKNKFKRWRCPLGKHAGSDPFADIRKRHSQMIKSRLHEQKAEESRKARERDAAVAAEFDRLSRRGEGDANATSGIVDGGVDSGTGQTAASALEAK